MKLAIKSLLAVAALGAASLSNAALIPASGKVTIQDTTFDGGSGTLNIGGGEFQANIAGYAPFYTFCLEIEEDIDFGVEFDYTLSNAADSQGDRISKGTAMLFELFTKGKLYDRSLDAAHEESAGYLQAAIWVLENEVFGPHVSVTASAKFFNVATNPYLNKAIAAFGSLANAQMDDDLGKVKAMNLTIGNTQYQDVLVYVPDSGATLALLGLGLVGLAAVRRRR